MSNSILSIIKKSSRLEDNKLARQLRKDCLDSILKFAEESLLEDPNGITMEHENLSRRNVYRGGPPRDPEKNYNLAPEHKKVEETLSPVSRSLSTRYSPDHVGVSARRISDGVYQDPITNKIYNWNEGFKTDDGDVFDGGSISLQTDLVFNE